MSKSRWKLPLVNAKKKTAVLEKKLSATQVSRPVTAKATVAKTRWRRNKPLECNPDVGIFACETQRVAALRAKSQRWEDFV